jgi:hypothetical protein
VRLAVAGHSCDVTIQTAAATREHINSAFSAGLFKTAHLVPGFRCDWLLRPCKMEA